jgi:hypothetical protein
MKPQVQEAIRVVDSNIEMFKGYVRPNIHPEYLARVKASLAQLQQDREELLAWDADPTVKLSYHALMWMCKMPAWGYKGT